MGQGSEATRGAAAATIRDVAARAGVSMATVSRALNGHPSVTVETRQRVQAAATALSFTPSGAARSLTTRRTQTVAALLPELHGELLSELIRGIEVAARAQQLHLLVASLASGDDTAAVLRSLAGRIDGVIVMPPRGAAVTLPRGTRAVLLEAPAADAPSFQADHRGGAAAMTRHLLAQGHRHIAFIAGPAGDAAAAERRRGFDEVAQAAGIETQLLQGDYSERSGHAAGQAIAALAERPGAVFAAGDMMAVGCLAALNEAGLEVPRDIALAGFDDIPMARYLRPALTTVRMPIAELGGLALQRLVADIAAGATPAPPTRQTVATEVVVRASCAPGPNN